MVGELFNDRRDNDVKQQHDSVLYAASACPIVGHYTFHMRDYEENT